MLKKLYIDISLLKALDQILSLAEFLKGLLANKRKLKELEMPSLDEEFSVILMKSFPLSLSLNIIVSTFFVLLVT